jgi:hypothetical protein
MTERPDPYRSVARELLCVLADEGRPMSLRELDQPGRLEGGDAAFQLSVARVAGFVRAVPGLTGPEEPPAPPREPRYQPTTLGWMIARRTSRAGAIARQLRVNDDAPWATEVPGVPPGGSARARADAAVAAARAAARRRVA